jgi:hypothetical protein
MRRGLTGSRRLRRFGTFLVAGTLAVVTQLASADAGYAEAWGPSVGSTAPLLAAEDQDGRQQTLASLAGANGLLFVFNRSVDW